MIDSEEVKVLAWFVKKQRLNDAGSNQQRREWPGCCFAAWEIAHKIYLKYNFEIF
jgi:hypothetical protein